MIRLCSWLHIINSIQANRRSLIKNNEIVEDSISLDNISVDACFELRNWLDKNVGEYQLCGHYSLGQNIPHSIFFTFQKKEDGVLFKLKWL